MRRWMTGLLVLLLTAALLPLSGCGRSGGAKQGEDAEFVLTEVEITDEELAEAVGVYERAAKKYDEKQESETKWSTEGMTRIYVADCKSHATVFYADRTHVLALNYFYDKASGQYYYAYSVSARLTKKGMKQKVTGQVPVYNNLPENITASRRSDWWVSSSVSKLERLYKGREVNARIELRNAKGVTYWFYCQDEA
ncbi:MAG: hypothetical protein IJH75_07440 [Mogibacterium sp.]|nr:hypothetical protein [Mogibacterium sp.]